MSTTKIDQILWSYTKGDSLLHYLCRSGKQYVFSCCRILNGGTKYSESKYLCEEGFFVSPKHESFSSIYFDTLDQIIIALKQYYENSGNL
jgi:hypothetical protein